MLNSNYLDDKKPINHNNHSISDPDEISMQLTSLISFCEDIKKDIQNSFIQKEVPIN